MPGLRFGSFAAVLEEYAEAKLFATWLKQRRVPPMAELSPCNATEYIGGLCDLTGELGRFAVARGTERDVASVEKCLDTDLGILSGLLALPLPGNLNKKMDPLRKAVSKLESMLYELSLLRHGRTSAADGVKDAEPPPGGGGKGDDE
jgi:predicted translin family RNA/ssDNA-binding protein